MINAFIQAIVESFLNIFGKKEASGKRVVVVCENGYSVEEEVRYTESGKAFITHGGVSVFLDNPDQKEGEVKPYTNGSHNGYVYKRWYYI